MTEGNSTAPAKSPEGSAAGDEGNQQQSVAKTPTVKDRQCKYCHQAFTSSSLGRHLDQYLFKKKPDGIHDVEEIRRIRSSITRRQARTSSSKRDSPDVAGGKGQHDSPGVAAQDSSSRPRDGAPRFLFNTPTWHSTGVINDIPDPGTSQEGTGSSRLSMSQSRTVSTGLPDYASRGQSANNPDTARALELALREVLDNIKAATSRTRPRLSPFDFDLQAQTFPALCLLMLPPPPSLFSTHPFPTTSSFPLEPPGVGQVEVVRHALRAHIDQWRRDQLTLAANQSGSGKGSMNHDPNMINRTAQQHEEMSSRHLDLAYQHWMVLPPEVKRQTWQLEITRAFARETEKRKQLDAQLVRVQQEANQLRAQVEKLGSCQWPREFAIFPPDMLPLSREAARELNSQDSIISPGSSRWDYDNVVAKWKRVVMHDKSMGRVGVGYANSVSEDPGLDSNSSSNRSKAVQTVAAASPDNSSGTAANSNNQQASPHQSHNRRNSVSGPQAKRQRLMNGGSKDANTPEGENNPTTGANTNGISTAWSPNSVQSLLVSNAAAPPSTSTPPSTRFGVS
ncbi:hypothetical protein VTN77DRAFT_3670 [Rasamsonia byssochlamydoides]|uniref:uncharacterized protein n=1 Tax=Rasamsonia byssochlamydoides TaxID=89139 RepID=UPI003743293A